MRLALHHGTLTAGPFGPATTRPSSSSGCWTRGRCRLLTDDPGRDLAYVVSDSLFDDVVRTGFCALPPRDFQAVKVTAKGAVFRGHIHTGRAARSRPRRDAASAAARTPGRPGPHPPGRRGAIGGNTASRGCRGKVISSWRRTMADDAALVKLVQDRDLGVLATLKRDGRPQLSNINYHFDADRLLVRISITASRAKARNLARDPRASLHVSSPDGWSYAVAEGNAELSAVAADPHDAAVEELIEVYRAIRGGAPRLGRLPPRHGRGRPPRRPPPRRPPLRLRALTVRQ